MECENVRLLVENGMRYTVHGKIKKLKMVKIKIKKIVRFFIFYF